MPWKEKSKTMLRAEFIQRVLKDEDSFSALCREYGISRPTGYKWLRRYQNEEGLEDQDKTPFHQPRKTPEQIEAKILEIRHEHPAMGARKIARIMENQGQKGIPSPSTITEILRRNGEITPEASAAPKAIQRFAMEHANDMWQTDYKGHFRLPDGSECHPLNIIDDHSRYCLCSRAMPNETFETFQPVLTDLFQEYGMPRSFLSDNGNPWGSGMRNGFSRVDVWLMQLGVMPLHGRIHHPQTQGKCESYNRSLEKELLHFRTFTDMEDAAAGLEAHRQFYNKERPHHALNLDVPEQHYRKSEAKYPERIKTWEYPEGYRLIRVGSSGHIRFKGHEYYLGEALQHEIIGMRESHLPGRVTLEYREFRIARINLEDHTFDFRHAQRKQEA